MEFRVRALLDFQNEVLSGKRQVKPVAGDGDNTIEIAVDDAETAWETLNINLPLTGETSRLACEMNNAFVRDGGSEIAFEQGGCYPHLTLLMGAMFALLRNELKERVASFASELGHLEIPLLKVGRPDTGSPYVFMEVGGHDLIRRLKLRLAEQVEDLLTPSEHANADTIPHITVAYLAPTAKTPEMPTVPPGFVWRPGEIAVSATGPHGTCIRKLSVTRIE